MKNMKIPKQHMSFRDFLARHDTGGAGKNPGDPEQAAAAIIITCPCFSSVTSFQSS